CTPHVYTAGQSFVDHGGTPTPIILNESTGVAQTIAGQLIPAGQPRRADAAAPGKCSFYERHRNDPKRGRSPWSSGGGEAWKRGEAVRPGTAGLRDHPILALHQSTPVRPSSPLARAMLPGWQREPRTCGHDVLLGASGFE